jgi:hypothetical protein
MPFRLFFIVLISSLLMSLQALSQDYRFHKVFFYSFTKYVQWPENYTEDVFKIGVFGKSEITPLLEEMAEMKSVESKKIEVVTVDAASLNQKLNMLFVPRQATSQFMNIKNKLDGKPTLLISEGEGLGQKGSMINFKEVEGKLKFEVNTKVIEASGLKVSRELVRFGEEI